MTRGKRIFRLVVSVGAIMLCQSASLLLPKFNVYLYSSWIFMYLVSLFLISLTQLNGLVMERKLKSLHRTDLDNSSRAYIERLLLRDIIYFALIVFSLIYFAICISSSNGNLDIMYSANIATYISSIIIGFSVAVVDCVLLVLHPSVKRY